MKKKNKKNKRLRQKILLPSLVIILMGMVALLLLVGRISATTVNGLTNELIRAKVNEHTNKFDSMTSEVAGVVSFLSTVVEDSATDENPSREKIIHLISNVLMENDNMMMAWTCWEPNAFDGKDAEYAGTQYHDETGRFIPYLVKNKKEYEVHALRDYDDPVKGDYYQGVLSSGKMHVTDPYYYEVNGEDRLVFTIAAPIIIDGEVVGVVGADISVETLDKIISKGKILEDGYLFAISPSGYIISHRDQNYAMKHYTEVWLSGIEPQLEYLIEHGGVSTLNRYSDVLEEDVHFSMAADSIVSGERYWIICGVIPERTVQASANRLIYWVALVVVVQGIVIFITLRFISYTKELKVERDQAKESADAKSAFLANMSHEIRTPLNAIIGMTKIAKGSGEAERVDDCLEKIDEASLHLLGIINDVLDMSKISNEKFLLAEGDFLIEDMLKQVKTVILSQTNQKQQEFLIRIDQDVPYGIVSDMQRLAQVVMNLLSNACKFTPDLGKICLSIHKEEESDGYCRLLFEIQDNGIGISEEGKEKLFQAFEQEDGSISRRFGGTGLGLAISKNIVEAMDGRIWVESEADKGSIFSFTIHVKVSEVSPEIETSNQTKELHMAVVDRRDDFREAFLSISQGLYESCRGFENLEEVQSELDAGKTYDIWFVAYGVRCSSGIEIARMIRKKQKDTPVVLLLSGMEWENVSDAAVEIGIRYFMTQPILPHMIIECVDKIITPVAPTIREEEKTAEKIFEGKTILLVEDVDINREIVIVLLEDTGVHVVEAENGVIACRLMEENPMLYDLILMDIHMPEMDGYEASKRIRLLKDDYAKEIPIVAMTANVFQEDIERCRKVGMNDHIGKPINVEKLMEVLKEHL